MNTKSIKFIFSKPKHFNLFSFLIMLVTRSKFSHVAIHFVDERTGQEMVFEASHGEAHYLLFDTWKKKNAIVNLICFEIPENKYKWVISKFNKWSEKVKYGALSIVGIVISYIFPSMRKNVLGDKEETLFCSELGTIIFLGIFDLTYTKKGLELMSPKDTFELVHGYESQ